MEFLPIIAIAALFYLLIIRPTTKRQKALQSMQSSLGVGDEVMLTSGIFGTVQEVADDHLRVLVADGVSLKVVRGAIGSVVTSAPALEETEEYDGHGEIDPADPDGDSGRSERPEER